MFNNLGKIQNILDIIAKILTAAGLLHSTVQHVIGQFHPVAVPVSGAPVPAPVEPVAAPAVVVE